tara:strand:+ start:868 stop:1758 length:891 start_codon:yes stop_codon:yes gene_type:complete
MSYQNNENVGTVGNILEQIEATLESTSNIQPSAGEIDSMIRGKAMSTLDNAPEESEFRRNMKKGLGSREKNKDDDKLKPTNLSRITSFIPEIHQLLKGQIKHHNYTKESFTGEEIKVASNAPVTSLVPKTQKDDILSTTVDKSIRPRPFLDSTDFLKKLAMKESTNNYRENSVKDAFGLIQMTKGRLDMYNKNNDTDYTTKQYLNSDTIQDTVNKWHINDIDRLYYEKLNENYPNMNTMTLDSFRAVAHLGGNDGALKYVKTKKLSPNNPNKYNPTDGNTYLSDYDSLFFNPKGTK